MGIISHVLVTSMRKPLLSAKVIIYSMISIGFLSYMFGTPHVRHGMNPSLRFSSRSHADHHHSSHYPHAHLDGQPLWSQYPHHFGVAIRARFRLMFVSGGSAAFSSRSLPLTSISTLLTSS